MQKISEKELSKMKEVPEAEKFVKFDLISQRQFSGKFKGIRTVTPSNGKPFEVVEAYGIDDEGTELLFNLSGWYELLSRCRNLKEGTEIVINYLETIQDGNKTIHKVQVFTK